MTVNEHLNLVHNSCCESRFLLHIGERLQALTADFRTLKVGLLLLVERSSGKQIFGPHPVFLHCHLFILYGPDTYVILTMVMCVLVSKATHTSPQT